MDNKKLFLWIVIALIAGFLVYQIIKRIRISKRTSTTYNTGNGTTTSSATNTNTNTNTNTSTSTVTGTSTDTSTVTGTSTGSVGRTGCVPPLTVQGRMVCGPNRKLTQQSNGQYLCC